MTVPLVNYEVSQAQNVGITTTTSLGSSFITTGTANTKMAYTQLIASTATDIGMLFLNINQIAQTSNGNSVCVDIAIGAAGSEIDIIPNVVYSWGGVYSGYGGMMLPISIPAGSRISYRYAFSVSTGETFDISLQGFTANFHFVTCYDSIGFNSGSTSGTSMTGASASNAKGPYSQITSSTSRDYVGMFVVIDTVGQSNTKHWLLDIAVGASGSEVDILPNVRFDMSFGMTGCWFGFVPMRIPAGTRLSGRIQTSTYSSFFERPNVTIYGAVG